MRSARLSRAARVRCGASYRANTLIARRIPAGFGDGGFRRGARIRYNFEVLRIESAVSMRGTLK
jgi:hypothetical protein